MTLPSLTASSARRMYGPAGVTPGTSPTISSDPDNYCFSGLGSNRHNSTPMTTPDYVSNRPRTGTALDDVDDEAAAAAAQLVQLGSGSDPSTPRYVESHMKLYDAVHRHLPSVCARPHEASRGSYHLEPAHDVGPVLPPINGRPQSLSSATSSPSDTGLPLINHPYQTLQPTPITPHDPPHTAGSAFCDNSIYPDHINADSMARTRSVRNTGPQRHIGNPSTPSHRQVPYQIPSGPRTNRQDPPAPAASMASPITSAAHDKDMKNWNGGRCSTHDCMEHKNIPPRSIISQYFGRNKSYTRKMPGGVIANYCRKCYQTQSYRYQKDNDYFTKQAELVEASLNNAEKYQGDRDWQISLCTGFKKLVDGRNKTIADKNEKSQAESSDAELATNLSEPAVYTTNKVGNLKTFYSAKLFDFIEEELEPLLGYHKTTAECKVVLSKMEEFCKTDTPHHNDGEERYPGTIKLPEVEFLPVGPWGTKIDDA